MKACLRERRVLKGEASYNEVRLEIERERLDNNIEIALMCGLGLSDAYKLDMKRFWYVYRAFIKKREMQINDILYCGHLIALKIAQGVNGSDRFSDKLDRVELLNSKSKEKDIAEMANNFNMKPETLRNQLLKG